MEFTPRGGGPTLRGWYIHGETGGPVIVCVHGLGSKRSGDEAVKIAAGLAERGFGSLLFDLRGHGDSDDGRVSGGYFERLDALGAFDYLIGRGVPAPSIGFLGFSMGAATTVLAAAEEEATGAIVLDSPYAKATEFIANEAARKTPFPKWSVPLFVPTTRLMAATIYGINLGAMEPERAVAGLGYPILVIHGTADTRIPLDNGVRVHGAAPPGSRLWLVEDADHVDAFKVEPKEYIDRLVAYYDERLA